MSSDPQRPFGKMCRFYAPDRDMELVRKINPHPETWEDFLEKTGFDGTQSLQDIRSKYT